MLTPLHRVMQWSALFGTTGHYHIYLSNFNLQHWPTLKRVKRFKSWDSRASISTVIMVETKEHTLTPREDDSLINTGLCTQPLGAGHAYLLLVGKMQWERCVCMFVSDEQLFRLWSRHQAPSNLCPSQPLLPDHLSDLHRPAMISDICLILTT